MYYFSKPWSGEALTGSLVSDRKLRHREVEQLAPDPSALALSEQWSPAQAPHHVSQGIPRGLFRKASESQLRVHRLHPAMIYSSSQDPWALTPGPRRQPCTGLRSLPPCLWELVDRGTIH